jgi:hypothetical protein
VNIRNATSRQIIGGLLQDVESLLDRMEFNEENDPDAVVQLIESARALRAQASLAERPLELMARLIIPTVCPLEENDASARDIAVEVRQLLRHAGLSVLEPAEASDALDRICDWGREILLTAHSGAVLEPVLRGWATAGWQPTGSGARGDSADGNMERLTQDLSRFALGRVVTATSGADYYECGVFLRDGAGLIQILADAVGADRNRREWARRLLAEPAFLDGVRCDRHQRDMLTSWIDREDELATAAFSLLLASEGLNGPLLQAAVKLMELKDEAWRTRMQRQLLETPYIRWSSELIGALRPCVDGVPSFRRLALALLGRVFDQSKNSSHDANTQRQDRTG